MLPVFCVVVASAAKNDYAQNGKKIIILGINMEPLVFGTKRRILRIEKSFIILWRGVDGGVCQTDGRC